MAPYLGPMIVAVRKTTKTCSVIGTGLIGVIGMLTCAEIDRRAAKTADRAIPLVLGYGIWATEGLTQHSQKDFEIARVQGKSQPIRGSPKGTHF